MSKLYQHKITSMSLPIFKIYFGYKISDMFYLGVGNGQACLPADLFLRFIDAADHA